MARLETDRASTGRGLYRRIWAIVRRIPPGKASTYGDIAAMVGGCTARMVGYAMAALPEELDVPWQRVINSAGRVSPRAAGDGHLRQRELLMAEGVLFDRRGRVDLDACHWAGPSPAWLARHGYAVGLLPAEPPAGLRRKGE